MNWLESFTWTLLVHLGIDDVPYSIVNSYVASLAGDTDIQNFKLMFVQLAEAIKSEENEMYHRLVRYIYRTIAIY